MLHVYFLFQTSFNNISYTNLTEIYRTLRIPAFAFQGLLVLDNFPSSYHIQPDNDCYVLNCMLFNFKIENNLFDEALHYLTLLHFQEI